MKKSIEKIPIWSLGYLINGDVTGLTDEEIKMIEDWWHIQRENSYASSSKRRIHNLIFRIIPFSVYLPRSRTVLCFTRITIQQTA